MSHPRRSPGIFRGQRRRVLVPPSQPRFRTSLVVPWKQWESVAVRIFNIPPEVTTSTLWQAFSKEGSIFSIDIFDDVHGKRGNKGKIRFRPPPSEAFWKTGVYAIKLDNEATVLLRVNIDETSQTFGIPSPVQEDVLYPPEIRVKIKTLDIGVLQSEDVMLPLRTLDSPIAEKYVVLDLKRRMFFIYFPIQVLASRYSQATPIQLFHQYRIQVPFSQLVSMLQWTDRDTDCRCHFTYLDTPPIYHRRITDISRTFYDDSNWRESDTWFRQTDINNARQELATLPVGLRKSNPIIDIGRWRAFKITYPSESNENGALDTFCSVLQDFNVAIDDAAEPMKELDPTKEKPSPVWRWIDYAESQKHTKSNSSLHELADEQYINLPFPVRYQLEVCISQGLLSEYTMTREFAAKLMHLGETKARRLLEDVAVKREVFFDPMAIFQLQFVKGATDAKIPPYCCYMRSARVTPSTIYYNTPTVDISNRVIRHYIEYADRFLRVRFTDEKLQGRINSTADNTMDEVFTRIKRTLANGIVIGDRRYEFLAFGNSQFREHGAYFFAPLPNLTAANIRAWMGHFNNIRNIAKHAARLGQCFSTTRAINAVSVQVKYIDDVVRNGFTFSDGVGKISRFLAQMASSELKIRTLPRDPPSAYQFRLGGCKGMLIVSPDAQRQEVHIRPSQQKFSAAHNGLEIIRWSQFSVATLNRQLILVLSSRGVEDLIFHQKLKTMLESIDRAMTSDPDAISLLKKYVDPNQMTLVMSQLVSDGFRKSQEPFVKSLLNLWKAWQLKYLKEKAKIAIDDGACLLGCMDETGILKGYFADKIPKADATHEEKLAALPEIFAQVNRPDGKREVIEGLCLLARNPSLHPGDIRVVRAVNVPELAHLEDVVVLPQTGDRDIASMCSGGDLDGDDYLVIWDQDLIPDDWFREPMNYKSNKARDLDRDVTVDDITSFFVTYMKNDCLPRIAHAHLAWADYLEDGVNEDKCVQVAQLHSDAVDYNKTGIPAVMTRSLQPRKWPHFMEKKHKPAEMIYRSRKVLGQLYDAVERIDFVPSLEMPVDSRILDSRLPVDEDLVHFAKELKIDYDAAMRRIMAQHEIRTEFEVWSTFVLRHANMSKDYKFHEEIGAISSSLREGYRNECYEKVGGRTFERVAPLAVAMYRVTYEEVTAALGKYKEQNAAGGIFFGSNGPKANDLPLISFPWLLSNVLGKIAVGHYELPETSAVDVAQLDKETHETLHSEDTKDSTQLPTVGPRNTETNKENLDRGEDDPFGLFSAEALSNAPSTSSSAPTRNNQTTTPSIIDSSQSINLLEEFGFESPVKSAPLPVGMAVQPLMDRNVNLIELTANTGNGAQPEIKLEHAFVEVDEKTVEDVIIEAMEDSGPDALDMLEELAAS